VNVRFVYSPRYDISVPGSTWLHRFDGQKYGRAWSIIRSRLGATADPLRLEPPAPATNDVLERVHTVAYLDSLSRSSVVAKAVELAPLTWIPNRWLQQWILDPMKFATAGTILAMDYALSERGVAMNVGGGYHHAFGDHGEGFCLFADVATAIAQHRVEGKLTAQDRIAVIDLDAHRGNGFAQIHAHDDSIHIYDLYNFQVYPGLLPDWDPDRAPYSIPIRSGRGDQEYLDELSDSLPRFLDSVGEIRLAVYNAGADIVTGDPLGRLNVSPEGVKARDRFVLDLLARRQAPVVIVTSGGYTDLSHVLIAELGLHVAEIGSKW
jgi:histone deacetylase 11